MAAFAITSPRKKICPNVLFILQGAHHLALYENVFRYCTDLQWLCLFPKISEIPASIIDRFYNLYGVKFFTDGNTALAHFTNIDAVITTFAIPHAAHLKFIKFISIAYDLGIPLFEFQHGLFQLGITYREESALIGAGVSKALTSLNSPNFIEKTLAWDGVDAVGYPPAVPALVDSIEPSGEKDDVVILTNLHWNLLTERERDNCYRIIGEVIPEFPQVSFRLVPHPSEINSSNFKRLEAKLKSSGTSNFKIARPETSDQHVAMLASARLVVVSISTVMLDCELLDAPTVVFRNSSQRSLLEGLKHHVSFGSTSELSQILQAVLQKNYKPSLRTGRLHYFSPDRLLETVMGAIQQRRPPSLEQCVKAIAWYSSW